ncbi:glycoside hydrolase/phage tail family protein [Tabrizicola sp.]|uniref:baseplate multidomain protein megatron n=1 Tax=Tabrizicola sp. TaxID=2005166 RepID=UPI002617BFB6|nr:glycoside hydrolase/phage tail family protein [Tabrizicola sp.]MDM7931170.1 glycoside hydrolase/phage tail family protein [Tabrizicola sp.]
MATLLLSAAGAAVGAGFGGTVLGLSGAVIGRAIGATLGRVIDQRLLGAGSDPVDVGRIDRLRLTGAGEGASIGQLWGRMRLGGQIIWATEFAETVQRRRTGKGAPKPKVSEYSYSVSLAIALCEGEILRVGRIWADGNEISPRDLNLRIYSGTEAQLPDPKIEAVEGAGSAPAYRGLAYVVIEDLELAPYGNRVPQFSFEVIRAAQGPAVDGSKLLSGALRGVALIPGTGEYGLATTPVHYAEGLGRNRSANVHSPSGLTDFATSLEHLTEELPVVGSVVMVVSWFGNDLRCASCEIRPKVEQSQIDGVGMPWRAGGIGRSAALEVPKVAGASVYGGTPSDASVIQAIRALREAGKEVVFYPFILMDQLDGNGLPDPWTGADTQAKLPWRGRITLSAAPGQSGSPDRSALAQAEVDAFFGGVDGSQFTVSGETIGFSGPASDWGYRRFILHYARLCAVAGGVDAFCIGSEMRSLTQIRGAGDSFPAVAALRALAAEVRQILGPEAKIGYAADWSEYFGYQAGEDLYFHLDPLWADSNIDFIGIDNYMPLSDWREGETHADADWGSIYDLDYLKANVAGGEGFDWYYDGPEGALAQRRIPITDGAYGEPWVFRYKDLKSWWSNPHHDRIGGERVADPTAWVPGSKPFWFTEFGCPAVDKGTNQPNKFVDAKSSESGLPLWSNGRRDDLIQMQYLLAVTSFWADPANNPASALYDGPMVDMSHAHAWAWDARPFPEFPGQIDVWNDGDNYTRGHWLNGRATNQPLAAVVSEICYQSGVTDIDTSSLFGLVRGFQQPDVTTARAALQPLLLAFGFDVMERDGKLRFRNRDGRVIAELRQEDLALSPDMDGSFETSRAAEVETAGQVRLGFIDAQSSYEVRATEARFPDEEARGVSQSDLPLALTRAEGLATVERWLAEARVARDGARFALPKSRLGLGAGDVVGHGGHRYRIDRVEQAEGQLLEAVRVEPGVYYASDNAGERIISRAFIPPVPVFPVFLDLPLLTGDEVAHAPYVAVVADPWPGSVGVWSASQDSGYNLNRLIAAAAVIGVTETPLSRARTGVWDRGTPLRVRIADGELASADMVSVLNGANAVAIGDGSSSNWEVFQFAAAQVVAPNTYELSNRLRGQLGTDGLMPDVWPAGSTVVVLDLALTQLDLPLSTLGLARYYRIGASSRGFDDPNTVLRVEVFDGAGLRPYPVSHLRAAIGSLASVSLKWKRRTRINGDSWQAVEVPLGEETEAYLIRILQGSATISEYSALAPQFSYTEAMKLADGVAGPYRVEVAQVSAQFGPGPFRAIEVDG